MNVIYEIDFDDFRIPALSVQPLVENAVRHGIATYDKGGTIWIKVYQKDDKVIIEIIDDGVGKSNITKHQKKRKGTGIESARTRIENMSDGKLEIITTEQGTISRITLNNDDRRGTK